MEQDFIYIKETGTGSESAVRNVAIRIKSIVEGVDSQWETTGDNGRVQMGRQTAYAGLYRLYRQCHHQEWDICRSGENAAAPCGRDYL